MIIAEYDFGTVFRPGKLNKNADALSRLPVILEDEEAGSDDLDMIIVVPGSYEWYDDMQRYVTTGELRPETPGKDRKFIKSRVDRFMVMHEKIYHKNSVGDPQSVVRQEDRKLVLSGAHDDFGHCGARMTLTQMMRTYWWPTMAKNVRVH